MKGRNHRNPSGRNERAMAMLGHELDNVLNGLLGMTQLLRESGLSPEQDRWSCAIEQSGRQMRRLVARFRSGAGPVEPGSSTVSTSRPARIRCSARLRPSRSSARAA